MEGGYPSVIRFIDKKIFLKKGWGKKITPKSDTRFPLFEFRDNDDFNECNFFAEAKFKFDYPVWK